MTHILNQCFEKILILTTDHEFSKIRRERLSPELKEISYSFFYGVNYKNLDSIQKYYDRGAGTHLSLGQIACSISHCKIYEYIIENNIEKCLILEDDFSIDKKNIHYFKEAYEQLPIDWQLFYIGYGHNQATPYPNYSKNLYQIDKYYPNSTLGYAVTKDFAKILLESNSSISHTADNNIESVLQKYKCNAYCSVPKLLKHEVKDIEIKGKIYANTVVDNEKYNK